METQKNIEDRIKIIYEDDDLLVIDKPAGITVNKADTTKNEVTVQDWAEQKITNLKLSSPEKETSDFYKRGGVVHRLDKETSGILLLAKTPRAFEDLQKQFKERVVKKAYVALAHGKTIPQTGEINVPVGRLPWNRKRFGIIPGGRESVTEYKVLRYYQTKENETLSFLELYPQTGRTHQIRVHLKYAGYPIFSDFLYAGRKTMKRDRKILGRVFLHAAKISFTHPTSHIQLSFESLLPDELDEFLKNNLIQA